MDVPVMPGRVGRKRTVVFDGATYRVRSDKIQIPDLAVMDRLAALAWLNHHTYPRGANNPRRAATPGYVGGIQLRAS